jgi:hypothetical protein
VEQNKCFTPLPLFAPVQNSVFILSGMYRVLTGGNRENREQKSFAFGISPLPLFAPVQIFKAAACQ